ncbi:unnamed protein product [Urochloa humidicola]
MEELVVDPQQACSSRCLPATFLPSVVTGDWIPSANLVPAFGFKEAYGPGCHSFNSAVEFEYNQLFMQEGNLTMYQLL